MGAINNPHFYSTTSGTTPTTWITDDIDYPHSGLIKALSQGIRGNYAIKGSATDFDITLASSTYTTIAVLTGKAYRDGKLVTITALSATNLTGIHATEDVYQLLVAQADNTMALRGSNSVTNRLPDLTDGDIPIAVIKLVAGSAQGSAGTSDRLVQFLTTSKVSNDLSIGYDNSGYTEMSKISAASGGTTVEVPTAGGDFIIDNTDADKKIVARLGSDTSATAFEVRNNSDAPKLTVGGDGLVATAGNIKVGGNVIQASDGGSAITLDTSDNVTIGNNLKVGGNIIQASDGGNTITLDTSDNVTIGNNLKVGGNVIQASDGGSTITMDTSDNVTIAGDLTLHGGGSGADINLHNGGNATIEVGTTAAGTAGRDLTISAGTAATASSNNTDGGDLILKAGGGDGTGTSIMKFSTKVSGTDSVAERMRIDTDGKVAIGTDLKLSTSSDDAIIENVTQDKDIIFQVNDGGVTTEVMRIDGDVSRVGIGTTTPTANLHIKNTSETDNALRVETATSGTTAAPDISFFRNDSSIVDDQNLGLIKFDGIETHSGGSDAEVTYVSIAGTSLDASSSHATNSQAQGALKFYIKQIDDNTISASPFPSITFYGGTAKENDVTALDWAASIGLFRGDALPQNTTSNKEVGHIWTKTDAHLHYTAFHPSSQSTQGEDYPVLLGGKHSIWIPAEAISPRSNAGCADLTTLAAATNGRPDIRHLAFDKDSDEHGQFTIAMPKMWNEGTITAQFYWTNASATSGGVSWGLQGVSLSNSDAIDTAFGTAVVTDDAQVGTAKDVHISAESSAITIGGSPAADDLTCFQVYRDISDSNDTLNEDALLLGIKLFYTISGHNDE